MRLKLLCFYYFTKDDLVEIVNKLSQRARNGRVKQIITDSFDDIIKIKDWEEVEKSTNPETEVSHNVDKFQEILSDCKIFNEEHFKEINLHWIRVAPNHFDFDRILVFESILKDPSSKSKDAIRDRFELALNKGFEKAIDEIFKSKEEKLKDLYANIWVIEGEKGLKENGFNEKPHEAKIGGREISYETYYSDEAWYIIYSDTFEIKSVELSDFGFLLTVPKIKPKLDNECSGMESKKDEWQNEITSLILNTSKVQTTEDRKTNLADIVKKMTEYFKFDKEINNKLLQKLFTLETRINRAKQAAEGQIHNLISKDMEEYLRDSGERIRSLQSRWKESFDNLRDVYGISAQSVGLDIQSATSKTSDNIEKILDKANIVSIIVIALIVFQCGIMIAGEILRFSTADSVIIGLFSALVAGYATKLIL